MYLYIKKKKLINTSACSFYNVKVKIYVYYYNFSPVESAIMEGRWNEESAQGVNRQSVRPASRLWSPSWSGNLFPLKSLGFSRSWETVFLGRPGTLWETVSRGKLTASRDRGGTRKNKRAAFQLFSRTERLLPKQIGPLLPGTGSSHAFEHSPVGIAPVFLGNRARRHVRKYVKRANDRIILDIFVTRRAWSSFRAALSLDSVRRRLEVRLNWMTMFEEC